MVVPDVTTLTIDAPSYEVVAAAYDELRESFEAALSDTERREVLRRWDELRTGIDTWSSLASLHFNQDTRNPAYRAAREERDELMPNLIELATRFKGLLLASSHRSALEEELGAHVFALWDAHRRSFDARIEPDLVEESKRSAAYTELAASASFEFRGETLTLSELGKFSEVGDRGTRRDALRLKWQWFADNAEALDETYAALVALRNDMAQKLALGDFVELGYLRMPRIGFGRADVERFRAQIRTHVVPLCIELRKRQATALGLDKLLFWDETVHDPAGNPGPQGGHDWLLERAQEMFDELGGGLGDFFRFMREQKLLDLMSRPGKAGGGFCTGLASWGVPFIFANFNGTKHDVEVFTHEMGHAFQAWASRELTPVDYRWPTLEACEIHSMSLEFLTWPWMERFFGRDADRYRWIHLAGSILFLPYGAAVDHFQHLVYENPAASPADRHAMWQEMERTYLPWRDYGGLPHVSDGGLWQAQRHIYHWPFYYVDYALASACALQFWVRAEEDRSEAIEAYVELCARGGEASFHDLVRSAGLISPFDEGCLETVVARARSYLMD